MTIQSFNFSISKHFHYVYHTCIRPPFSSNQRLEMTCPCFEVGKRAMLHCLFVCLLSPNRHSQLHSSIIRTYFPIIITLNKLEMIFRRCFLCRRRCGFFFILCSVRTENCASPQFPGLVHNLYFVLNGCEKGNFPNIELSFSLRRSFPEKILYFFLFV